MNRSIVDAPGSPPERHLACETHEEAPAQFLDAVHRALEYIAAGDVYQANLSRLWQGECRSALDPVAIYRRLRAAMARRRRSPR